MFDAACCLASLVECPDVRQKLILFGGSPGEPHVPDRIGPLSELPPCEGDIIIRQTMVVPTSSSFIALSHYMTIICNFETLN